VCPMILTSSTPRDTELEIHKWWRVVTHFAEKIGHPDFTEVKRSVKSSESRFLSGQGVYHDPMETLPGRDLSHQAYAFGIIPNDSTWEGSKLANPENVADALRRLESHVGTGSETENLFRLKEGVGVYFPSTLEKLLQVVAVPRREPNVLYVRVDWELSTEFRFEDYRLNVRVRGRFSVHEPDPLTIV
jgi:hypothetical protein